MGLLSKFLNVSEETEKAAKDMVNDIISSKVRTAGMKPEQVPSGQAKTAPPFPQSGISWGRQMPDEENQYNYQGDYMEYFEHIFRDDFPQYKVKKSYIDGTRRVAYVFSNQEKENALIIELMPETSAAYKFRNDCRENNIPYLRFYYNHDGWWNTREYVNSRMKTILR